MTNEHDDQHPQGGPDPATHGADATGAPPAAPLPGDGDAGEPRRLSRRASWLAMGAVLLALVLVWIAPGVNDEHEDLDARVDAAAVGRPAPLHFTMKDMNGKDVAFSSFKNKVIVVNFWATWCGPCELEIPWLVELQKKYSGDLVVLGVSIDDTAETLKPYAEQKKMNYPVLVGLNREDVQDAFGPMMGVPVSVFIDRQGMIARRHTGIASQEQMDAWIQALL